jgi:hypothetical protein
MNYLTLRKISLKILSRVREADYANYESTPQAKINEARDVFITVLEMFAECLPKQIKRIKIVNGVENAMFCDPFQTRINNRINILSFSSKLNDCCKNIEEQEEIARSQEKIIKLNQKLKDLQELLLTLDPIADAEERAIIESKIEIIQKEIAHLKNHILKLQNNKDLVDYNFDILSLRTIKLLHTNNLMSNFYLSWIPYTEFEYPMRDCYSWCALNDRQFMKLGHFEGYIELVGRFKEFNYYDSASLERELDLDFKFIEPLITIGAYEYAKRFLKKADIELLKAFADEAIAQLRKLDVGYNN